MNEHGREVDHHPTVDVDSSNFPVTVKLWVDEDRRQELILKLLVLLTEYGARYRLKEKCFWENRLWEN